MSNFKPNYFQRREKKYGPRANEKIRALDVQVIDSSGNNLGVLPLKKAIETDIHDYNFKFKNARKFISKGDKVKFTVKFKGREMQHVELGKNLMQRIVEDTKDIAKVETHAKFEGRQMIMIIQPN